MTYTELVDNIQHYLENRESGFVADLPAIIQRAERKVYNDAQLPVAREVGTITTTNGVATVTMPADFLAVFSMYVAAPGGYEMLVPKEVDYVRAMYPDAQPAAAVTKIGPSGSEMLGTVASYDVKRWITSDWPVEWTVIWSLVPSPAGSRIESSVVTERQTEALLRYYLAVRNLGPAPVTVEARYVVVIP